MCPKNGNGNGHREKTRTSLSGFYAREINCHPILTKEQEVELNIKAKRGDRDALEKLVLSNLRLVISVVVKYYYWAPRVTALDFDDLIQIGIGGLMRAAEKYDHRRGAVSTYAVPWIRQKIWRAIAESELIQLPVWKRRLLLKANTGVATGSNRLGLKQTISLDTIIRVGGDSGLVKMLPNSKSPRPDDVAMAREELEKLTIELKNIVQLLRGMEKANQCPLIFILYYGLEDGTFQKKTLEGVGKRLNLYRQHVLQCIDRCFRYLATKRSIKINKKILMLKLEQIQRLRGQVYRSHQ